jgi:hypothetical protein
MNASTNSLTPVVENVGLLMVVLADAPLVLTRTSDEMGGLGTLIVTPAEGLSRFALSSTARLRSAKEPEVDSVPV